MPTPLFLQKVEPVPYFNLYNNISFCGFLQEKIKTSPICFVPLVEIILAVLQSLEGINFEGPVVPVTHCIPHIIGTCPFHQVKMRNKHFFGSLKQIVVIACSEQHDRLPFVLPETGILLPGRGYAPVHNHVFLGENRYRMIFISSGASISLVTFPFACFVCFTFIMP